MSERRVTLQVFTHPVCPTCPQAIRMAQALAAQRPEVEVRIVSLASERGRAEAREAEVLSVPTIVVGKGVRRFVGVPQWSDLVQAVEEVLARAQVR